MPNVTKTAEQKVSVSVRFGHQLYAAVNDAAWRGRLSLQEFLRRAAVREVERLRGVEVKVAADGGRRRYTS